MNICYDENCEQWWHHYWLPVECLWEFRYFLHLGPGTATHPNLNIGEDADLKFKLIYCVAKVDISHIQHLVVAFLLLLLFFFLLLLFLYRFCLWVPAEREKIRISARKHRFVVSCHFSHFKPLCMIHSNPCRLKQLSNQVIVPTTASHLNRLAALLFHNFQTMSSQYL